MVKLVYFLRTAFAGLRKSPFVHGVAALTMAVALFTTGVARFAVTALNAAIEGWGGDVELTVYLRPDVGAEQAAKLSERLRSGYGAEVRYVTAEAALERLRIELGNAGDVLKSLPRNPLPASLEVRPAPENRTAVAIAALAETWAALPEVESVEYGREWVERLELLVRAARGAGALVLLVVLVAAVVVVAATLQLAIYARRDEIEIQKLVGATDAFVKAPFLIEGMFQGFLGATLAAGGLVATAHYLGPPVARALGFLVEGMALPPLVDVRGWLELSAAGVGLGLAGSFVAVRRFLRV